MDSFTTALPAPRWRRSAHARRDHQRAKAAGPSRAALLTCIQMAQDAQTLPQDKTDGGNR